MLKKYHYSRVLLVAMLAISIIYQACTNTSGNNGFQQPPPPMLPVLTLTTMAATTYREFSASIEGSKDIEIRAQVSGYIDRIYVDEGARVKKGQLMFKINDRPFREQVNTAKANVAAAQAALNNAKINVDKLTPLVQHAVVSDVQLKSAQASFDLAKANVLQAQAMLEQAQINLGYTNITAPTNGYIGRIPLKTGSLVGTTTAEPLTVLSETNKMYAYFSLSENDFIAFEHNYEGKTIEEKLKSLPDVELILPDNSMYPQKGKIEMVAGQFDNSMGAIGFRAAFPNANALLRSGSTGRIRIPSKMDSTLVIPQEATFELQDKVLVFVVKDSNKVASSPVEISGRSGNYYLVKGGVTAGDIIVYSGLDRLQDGAVIKPELIKMDSLLAKDPM